ncbi:MAG: hypothetical protein Kow0092_13830 [Deferrisomatales bacterium]
MGSPPVRGGMIEGGRLVLETLWAATGVAVRWVGARGELLAACGPGGAGSRKAPAPVEEWVGPEETRGLRIPVVPGEGERTFLEVGPLPAGAGAAAEDNGRSLREAACRAAQLLERWVSAAGGPSTWGRDEALEARCRLLETVVDASPTPLFYQNAQGRYLGCNEAFARFVGRPKEQIVGRSGGEVVGAPGACEPGMVQESSVADALGRIRHVVIQTEAFSCPAGGAPGVVGTLLDITDRKRAEEALHRSEERFRRLVRTVPLGIEECDATGTITFCSEAYDRMMGCAPGAYVGKSVWEPMAPGPDRDGLKQYLEYLLAEQPPPTPYLTRNRTADGRLIDVQVDWNYVRDERGQVTGFISAITDVTERTRAEEALRASEEKFRVLVEESPLGVSLIGADGSYRYVNPKFTEMFGYTAEEIPDGRRWFEKAYPERESRTRAVKAWLDDLRGAQPGEARPRTFTVRCRDGAERVVHFRPVTLRTGDQLVIYEDITEQRNLQEQLLQAQKMEAVGTLASGVAHDFNNLLQAIDGYTQLVRLRLRPGDEAAAWLDEVDKAAGRAAELVRGLLAFSRKEKPQLAPLNLNRKVARAVAMLERTLPKMIRIETHLAEELWPVSGDAGRLEQVLLNLATNARDAMADGGRLVLRTENLPDGSPDVPLPGPPERRWVLLEVADTGCGMDAETLRHAFEPFFTTKGMGEGTGLGLSTVYGIVDAHGGRITCESRPGRGSTFRIYLPAAGSELQAQERPKTSETPAPPGTERILVVDDEDPVRQWVQRVLAIRGYSVVVAANGEEALDRLEREAGRVDLVVLDLGMPGMGGWRCLEELRSRYRHLPVIIVSGYAGPDTEEQARGAGAQAFLRKPFRADGLARKIHEVLTAGRAGGGSPR